MFLARASADVVRIKGFLVISKCTFARALLAHFAVFATCALPKVASRVQFLHWNHTHSFCRTFLLCRIARRGSSILQWSGVPLTLAARGLEEWQNFEELLTESVGRVHFS